MSRINLDTNRKVKINTRTYAKLISQGYVDDGVNLSIPVMRYKIQYHNRTIKATSAAVQKFLDIGYRLVGDELIAPEAIITTFQYEGIEDFMRAFDSATLDWLISLSGIVKINEVSIHGKTKNQLNKSFVQLFYEPDFDGEIRVLYQPFVLSEYGVLYEGLGNCVIKLFEDHLKDNNKENPELVKMLYERFEDGFFNVDFEYLAQKLGSKIIISSPLSKQKYGSCSKMPNLYISVNNNHAILTKEKDKPIVFVDDIDTLVYSNKHSVVNYMLGSTFITNDVIYKNRVLKVEDRSYDVENCTFTFGSEITYFMKLFLSDNPNLIEINKFHKNIEAIRTISQHGILYANQTNPTTKYTYDLKKAYTNFYQWGIYEGLPTDLDSCITEQAFTNDLLEYAGFGLITYDDLYNKSLTERWVSFPYIKMLIRQNRKFSFKYGLISRNKINLNTACFENAPKGMFHKVLGRLNAASSCSTYTTTDPLLAHAGLSSLSHTVSSENNETILYFAKKFVDAPNSHYYPYLGSYIQCYTEIMIEELAFSTLSAGGSILSVWVDEISLSMPFEGFTSKTFGLIEHFHTDKVSKIDFTKIDVNYKEPKIPIKMSKNFNSILQNKGNKIKITGAAGTGKTYINNQLSDQIDMELLTPTHEAGQQYVENGNTYKTVALKLTTRSYANNIIVDECSMVNSKDCKDLETLNPNLFIITGDDRQLEPVEGEPIDDTEYNIIELTQNFRQAIDPEFSRKLNILRLNSNTDEKFGTPINENDAINLVKAGGIIACITNSRVKKFNILCNDGLDFKNGSRVRFIKNKLNKGIYKGLMGVIEGGLIKSKNNTYDLETYKSDIELAYAMTVHKLQGRTLKNKMVYDNIKTTFRNIRYTAYSRLIQECDLYIL
jgi:hypothetical protein